MDKKIRIFLSEKLEENKDIILNKDQSHYVINVMRLKVDNELLVFNGKEGEFLARIAEQAKKIIEVMKKIGSPRFSVVDKPIVT